MYEVSAILYVIVVLALGLTVWLYPVYYISKSQIIVGRNERLAWMLACLFLSWLGLIFFFLLAPLKPYE